MIVGAGVTGCSIAMQLAMRKAGRILVLEKSEVGFGGSGRSSALVRMHYSFPGEVQLAVKSLEIFKRWPEVVGRPGDFRPHRLREAGARERGRAPAPERGDAARLWVSTRR